MVKFCMNCGAKHDDSVEFCTECGKRLNTNSNSPAKITGNSRGIKIRNFVGEINHILCMIGCVKHYTNLNIFLDKIIKKGFLEV